ncbi:Hydroxymethylpyrimidine/phosphomethylpyrimidine kinase [Listeria monocytogenes]|nr:Hydroxymethylpyrimidine/phosphomethylpyrimidine kinase [Listeria monocytogenes]
MFIHGFQEEVGDLWQETLQHPFVQSLADGTLEKEAFYYYLYRMIITCRILRR